jgi:hypothetical protein
MPDAWGARVAAGADLVAAGEGMPGGSVGGSVGRSGVPQATVINKIALAKTSAEKFLFMTAVQQGFGGAAAKTQRCRD